MHHVRDGRSVRAVTIWKGIVFLWCILAPLSVQNRKATDTEVEGKTGLRRQLNLSLLLTTAFGKGAAVASYLLRAQGIRRGRREGFQGREPPTRRWEERFTSDL